MSSTTCDDDQPVVIMSEKIQPRGRGRPPKSARPEAAREMAVDAATDFTRARQVIRDVNQTRMLIARRMANLNLFPQNEVEAAEWRARPMNSDPPQVRILWQLKAEFDRATCIDDNYQRTQCRTTLLTKMADTINKCQDEAGRASDEWRKILDAQTAMDQKRKEHAEKMELEHEKLERSQGKTIDIDEINRIASQT
jgi:hypothetical protein